MLIVFYLGSGPLVFVLIYNSPYDKIVINLAAHSAVVLKAESVADKTEWLNKLNNVIQPSKGGQMKGASSEGGLTMRQSLSDGSLVSFVFTCDFCLLSLVVSVLQYCELCLNAKIS